MKRDPIRPLGQTVAGRPGAVVHAQGRAPSGGGRASTGSGAAAGTAATIVSALSPSRPGVNLASESVAGEEDPGASLDMGANASGSSSSNAPGAVPVSEPPARLNPGDEAAPGTPGTGEGICRECGGSGRLCGAKCPACDGTGKVTVGVGGA